MSRQAIFAEVKSARGGEAFSMAEVATLDTALDALGVPKAATEALRKIGSKGIALMHKWEGCRLKAYPDPGSRDGKPWTIGWGSTGPDIGPNTIWTQEQADERFKEDMIDYAAEVSKAIGGAATTQDQFDALVAFHYNTGKIGTATLTKKHNAGDPDGAAREFRKWVFNDGKKMQGLVNRRADEEKLYRGGWG